MTDTPEAIAEREAIMEWLGANVRECVRLAVQMRIQGDEESADMMQQTGASQSGITRRDHLKQKEPK
jgi:hypothetical protein